MKACFKIQKSLLQVLCYKKPLLTSLLLVLIDFTHCSGVLIVDFEKVNPDWVGLGMNYLNFNQDLKSESKGAI